MSFFAGSHFFGVFKRETKRKPLYFGAPIPNKRGPVCIFVSAFCAGGSRLGKQIFGLLFRLATTRACARDSGHSVLGGRATVDLRDLAQVNHAQPQNHGHLRWELLFSVVGGSYLGRTPLLRVGF